MVTGATSGIGEATAVALAGEGFDVIAVGRRAERLRVLEGRRRGMGREVVAMPLDVRVLKNVEGAVEGLSGRWREVDVLVNAAGLAVGTRPIQEGEAEGWDRMVDTNVKGLLYVTRAVTPLMVGRGRGHVVNVASIAGKEVYPGGNVYCATKAAVDALSRGMRVDLLPHGVKVTNVAPGMVETEFSLVRFGGDAAAAHQVYAGMRALSAGDVAEVIRYAVSLPTHVCLNDVVVMPTAQAGARDVWRG
jgi:NADP-dependent 3-hydroxy acid dehydrogenase YdfG